MAGEQRAAGAGAGRGHGHRHGHMCAWVGACGGKKSQQRLQAGAGRLSATVSSGWSSGAGTESSGRRSSAAHSSSHFGTHTSAHIAAQIGVSTATSPAPTPLVCLCAASTRNTSRWQPEHSRRPATRRSRAADSRAHFGAHVPAHRRATERQHGRIYIYSGDPTGCWSPCLAPIRSKPRAGGLGPAQGASLGGPLAHSSIIYIIYRYNSRGGSAVNGILFSDVCFCHSM